MLLQKFQNNSMLRKTTSPIFLKWARAIKQCQNSTLSAFFIFEKFKWIPNLPKLFEAVHDNAMYYCGPISHFTKCILAAHLFF